MRTENLGKMYRIGTRLAPPPSTVGRTVRLLGTPFEYLRQSLRAPSDAESFWAVRGVTLAIPQGEILGVIGRNGAGKSTLLKVLARITDPTEGRAEIRGRLASLLEVGTGFHPELTGRENIYLSGAVLGMRRSEVDSNFDAIAAFAGVEGFLDTPVKRYSSGMYVRLGFAVAAHLQSEILLIDEVLAVGDIAFQRKALARMGDVVQHGRTVLFVSHNLVAVQSLCTSCVWMDGGRLVAHGATSEVVARYSSEHRPDDMSTSRHWDEGSAPGTDTFKFLAVAIQTTHRTEDDVITLETGFNIVVDFANYEPDSVLHVTLLILDDRDLVILSSDNSRYGLNGASTYASGRYRAVCCVPPNLMNAGLYHVRCLVVRDKGTVVYRLDEAIRFEIVDAAVREGAWYGREPGVVRPLLKWHTEALA